uniref:Uncharacterized protein n=1 Tax=Graphocephala atropunctata TaxID=36148 RepID=A0A1B6MV12_9HEMI
MRCLFTTQLRTRTHSSEVRLLSRLGWRDSCRGHFKKLKLVTVVSLYIYEAIVLVTSSQQTRHQDLHGYNTRNAQNFSLPAHHRTLYEKKPSYAGAKFYNILPQDVKDENCRTFKLRLTRWLLERPFYSVNEFLNWQHFQH